MPNNISLHDILKSAPDQSRCIILLSTFLSDAFFLLDNYNYETCVSLELDVSKSHARLSLHHQPIFFHSTFSLFFNHQPLALEKWTGKIPALFLSLSLSRCVMFEVRLFDPFVSSLPRMSFPRWIFVLILGIILQRNVTGNLPLNSVDDDDVPSQLSLVNRTRSQNYFDVGMGPDDLAAVEERRMLDRPAVDVMRPASWKQQCRRNVTRCQSVPDTVLAYLDALDVQLSYHNMAADGEMDALDRGEAVVGLLRAGERLRHHAHCWSAIQPLMYALAVPMCTGGQRRLVPSKACRDVSLACGPRVMAALPAGWHVLRHCNDTEIFTNEPDCEVSAEFLITKRTKHLSFS